MKRLHIVPGLSEACNGIAAAAKCIAEEQNALCFEAAGFDEARFGDVDEVWVHSCWTPIVWRACHIVLREGKRLVRMLHGNLDPVRLHYHRWKKRIVSPIDKYFLRRADYVVATCNAEAEWIRGFEPDVREIRIIDLKRFFTVPTTQHESLPKDRPIHLLYMGRRHPLKGLEFLEEAIKGVGNVDLRAVSNAFGDAKEAVWQWTDVLVLPTLSDNFGLVVAEALERGKLVITTDGAPAWGDGNTYGGRLTYLRGYRCGSVAERLELLREAIAYVAPRYGLRMS